MSSSDEIDKMARLIRAYQHPLKYRIIQTLSVYKRLSTKELANKVKKSKQTVLRQIEELLELELVDAEEHDDGTTPYPKRVYSLNSVNTNLEVRGQDIVGKRRIDHAFIREYNAFRLSTYLGIKHIVDAMLNYQRRLNKESEKSDVPEALELLKDNLGSSKMKYLSKREVAKLSDIPKNRIKDYEDSSNDYLRIELILPIRRVLEMSSSEDWKKDGSLWFHDL